MRPFEDLMSQDNKSSTQDKSLVNAPEKKNPANNIDKKNTITTSNQNKEGLSSKALEIKNEGVQKPTIQLKRDVQVTTLSGEKVTIPEDEVLKAYEKGGKALLKDGREYIVSKNQYENIKNNSKTNEVKEFAPELKQTEETVKGGEMKMTPRMKAKQILDDNGYKFEEDMPGTEGYLTKDRKEVNYDSLPANIKKAVDKYVGSAETVREIKPLPTKYSNYTIPGGKNYKEILIKAPETLKKGEYGTDVIDKSQTFRSSHWDEPNVISHLRLNERTYNGKKVTFMEELQSDWAREGRSKGFGIKSPEYKLEPTDKAGVFKVYDPMFPENAYTGNRTQVEAMKKQLEANGEKTGVPNNPLLKNWQELSVKRALKEAVNNGSEYLAWTTGEQQAARYNLSKEVDSIKWNKNTKSAGGKYVVIEPKTNAEAKIEVRTDKNGIITDEGSKWVGRRLDEVVGKGISEKIMVSDGFGELKGEGLNIGGEWAKNLYDKQIKNIVEDITGGKVETLDMGLAIDGNLANKKTWHILPPENTRAIGAVLELKPTNIKVGMEISGNPNATTQQRWIITDVLGDGKFKAVEKKVLTDSVYFDTSKPGAPKIERDYNNQKEALDKLPETYKETFDISQKTTKQQGIELTPDIISRIKGEKLDLKPKSSFSESLSKK